MRLTIASTPNLEQISDWLTKIIVGLTLVNLGNIPGHFEVWVGRIAPGLQIGEGNLPVDGVFAGGVMVYFLVLGFLSGYIITRTQISSLFSRADANLLFNRRDTDLLGSIAEMFETGLPNMANDELRERITKSSMLTQNSIFAYTKNCRKIFHKRRQPENVSLTVPVFSALVESDYEGLNHQYRGQLGYALKDQHLGKKKPWDEATEKAMIPDLERAVDVFEQAILIRGDWKSKGYGVYELNLAITKLELLHLWKKYKLNPLSDEELALEKERIRDCFEVALNSGEAYVDTVRRYYSSWYDPKTGKAVVGDV